MRRFCSRPKWDFASNLKGIQSRSMPDRPVYRSPKEFQELALLRDSYRKQLYAQNDSDEVKRMRKLIEQLQIQLRGGDAGEG
jgi:hypothetical protein